MQFVQGQLRCENPSKHRALSLLLHFVVQVLAILHNKSVN